MPAFPTLPDPAPAPVDPRPDVPAQVASFELVEILRAPLETLLADLAEAAPRLTHERRLHDGAWVLGLRGDRERDGDTFGRAIFELRPRLEEARVDCTFRATAGPRDLPSRRCRVAGDEAGVDELSGFAETALLAFAKAYFDMGSPTIRSTSP